MMKRFALAILMSVVLGTVALPHGTARAADALSELRKDPRYQGRILGTHLRRSGGGYVYEVRILTPEDRVLLVYVDPETGRVIGDSGGRGNGSGRDDPRRKKRK